MLQIHWTLMIKSCFTRELFCLHLKSVWRILSPLRWFMEVVECSDVQLTWSHNRALGHLTRLALCKITCKAPSHSTSPLPSHIRPACNFSPHPRTQEQGLAGAGGQKLWLATQRWVNVSLINLNWRRLCPGIVFVVIHAKSNVLLEGNI